MQDDLRADLQGDTKSMDIDLDNISISNTSQITEPDTPKVIFHFLLRVGMYINKSRSQSDVCLAQMSISYSNLLLWGVANFVHIIQQHISHKL